ncbi:murein transglycosylase [Exophiala aquamarina CBS 119918]|uniref:Probable glucan endo-1,3-beta-glucosidase eglC n=1 Tax=Exophiala aquamarina CBS 119918 TaxID=1182545 RepID=A0A072PG02_9EURO|nr:murein transglycosylase [Exophiala aquamarina CBS 119918]KEF54485.1 murein transglycosylase [Exophiala aquamarina CBS 119918]
MRSVALLLLGFSSAASTVRAQLQGFNYGATFEDGSCRLASDFVGTFNSAHNLAGTDGSFTSARLYTTIQCGTTNEPISAIQAAIDTDTSLLLGLWASAGDTIFDNEIAALSSAVAQYGSAFTDRIIGISVGSEDLYRSSPQGIANEAGVGVDSATIVRYINRVKDLASQTPLLQGKSIGHVDTWTAWVLPENAPVANAVDWLGYNSFPYFEDTLPNSIEDAESVFFNALGATEGVSGGKPVWVTETGWPHSGPTSNLAVASVENAQTYWSSVGCGLFGQRNIWWYTLSDANTAQTEISFGVAGAGNPPSTTPIYDLSC